MFAEILIGALFLFFYFLHQHYQYWKKRGVPGPKPQFFFGNIWDCITFKRSIAFYYNDVYDEYPNDPYVGVYKLFTPIFVVRDQELAKDVMIRNFLSFAHNDSLTDIDTDPLFGRNPFTLRDEMWEKTRKEAIRCFTGSKMRAWFPLINTFAEEMVKYIDRTEQPLEAKTLSLKFTVSNVANCSFGVDVKCFEEDTEFENIAKIFVNPTGVFVNHMFPNLRRYIKIKVTPKLAEDKLLQIVKENIKSRIDNNIVRNDFLQVLLDIKKDEMGDENFALDIAGHTAGFLVDGYETSSVAMSFFLYNIASHKDIQEKIRNEINNTIREHGELNYESLQSMEYLDAALTESMRMYPALPSLVKECSKDFALKNFVVEKGTTVIIPAWKLQNDPKYWDEPEKFRPERFLRENREKLKGLYLAFGEGPRICIGMRFGSMQIKIGVAHLIRNYEISVNSKTLEPIKIDPLDFLFVPVGGLWLDFKKLC